MCVIVQTVFEIALTFELRLLIGVHLSSINASSRIVDRLFWI